MTRLVRNYLTLVYYDYPQVFIGCDDVGSYFACMAVAENELGPKYYCAPISEKRRDLLLLNHCDLRDIFKTPEVKEFYSGVFCSDTNGALTISKVRRKTCPKEYLPDSGVKFDNVDFEISKASIVLNSTIAFVSLSAYEAKGSARIRSVKLAEFLSIYQYTIKNLVKYIASKLDTPLSRDGSDYDMDVFGFSHGSFTVKVRSAQDNELFGDSAFLSKAFEELNEFLSLTEDHAAAIRYMQGVGKRAASSLIKLLEFMSKNSCPIKHQWANPNTGPSDKVSIDLQAIIELIGVCRSRNDLFNEEISIEGHFDVVNFTKNTWTLIESGTGKKYFGGIDELSNETLAGIVVRTTRYKVLCTVTAEIELGTTKESIKHNMLTYMEA